MPKKIKDITELKPESLEDIDKQDIFVLNLQRAIQSTIDLASHIEASEGLGIPEKIKDKFLLLERAANNI